MDVVKLHIDNAVQDTKTKYCTEMTRQYDYTKNYLLVRYRKGSSKIKQ